MGAEGVGQLVVGFAGARLADATLLGGVRTQQVGTALDRDVVLFRKFVDALKADIAPGSNVVVPNDHVDGVGIVRMAVGWRLCGHGITSEMGTVGEEHPSGGGMNGLAGQKAVQQWVQSFEAVDMVAICDVGMEAATVDENGEQTGVAGALNI